MPHALYGLLGENNAWHCAGTWVEVSKHFIDSINRDYLDIPRTASLFENRVDSEIDFMFVARNFMAFIKNGAWKPSSQTSDGQGDTAHRTLERDLAWPSSLTIVQQILRRLVAAIQWAVATHNGPS